VADIKIKITTDIVDDGREQPKNLERKRGGDEGGG
jgi:hypothetical protein